MKKSTVKPIVRYIPITNINHDKAKHPHYIGAKTNELQLSVQFRKGTYYLDVIPVETFELGGVRLIGATVGAVISVPIHSSTRNTAKQRAIATSFAEVVAIDALIRCEKEYGTEWDHSSISGKIFPDAEHHPITKGSIPPKTPRENLVNEELLRKFRAHPYGSQEYRGENAKVLAKYVGNQYVFLVTEAKLTSDNDWILYGKTYNGYMWGWGWVLFSDLEHRRFPMTNTGVELDEEIPDDATVAELSA